MAKATTIKGGAGVVLLLGNDATPIVYAAPCGLEEKSIRWIQNANEQTVPDCTNPDDPAVIERPVESVDMQGSGSGVLASESVELWEAAASAGESVAARLDIVLPTKTISYTGKIVVTEFEVTGMNRQNATVSLSFAADGPLARTSS